MSYNIGPCRECGEVVERDAANICFECWAYHDAQDHENMAKKNDTGILLQGMPVIEQE